MFIVTFRQFFYCNCAIAQGHIELLPEVTFLSCFHVNLTLNAPDEGQHDHKSCCPDLEDLLPKQHLKWIVYGTDDESCVLIVSTYGTDDEPCVHKNDLSTSEHEIMTIYVVITIIHMERLEMHSTMNTVLSQPFDDE